MSETFRIAREADVGALAGLAGHSFPGRSREYLEVGIRATRGGLESVMLGELEDRPVSLCLMHRFRQWVGGAALPTMGLGLVTVSPDQRRRRAAGRLVIAALRHARERGDSASALYPFRISFYQGLGYGLAGEALQYLVPPEALPDSPERARVRLADADRELEAIRSVYDRWIVGQTGQMARGPDDWPRVLAEREAFVHFGEGGSPEGYALLRYRHDLPPQERHLEVEERAWLTPAARRGLHAWMSTLSDQWRLIAYRAHPEEGFADLLREPRLPSTHAPPWGLWFPAATVMLGPMFRLLDVEAAWHARAVDPEERLTIVLECRDTQLPENEGPWTLRLEDGRTTVERGAVASADCTIRGDVSWISRLFIGAVTPTQAVELGAVQADPTDALPRLDRALRLPKPWTFDRF